jgi:transposase InsO family protein
VTNDDALYGFRLRLFALAREWGNVRAACRAMGVHPSSYYRWRRQLVRFGPEIPASEGAPGAEDAEPDLPDGRATRARVLARSSGVRPREDLRGAASSQVGRDPAVAQRGAPGPIPARPVDASQAALPLVAGYAAPPEPARPEVAEPRHLQVERPGQMVQIDCFFVGRLSGTKGSVWQYTAIDVGSSHCWAELHTTPKNPSARWTSHLAERVAADLAARGWGLQTVMTDNASEFRSQGFTSTITRLGGHHRFIHAGRPQTNGCVERVQLTILEECWKPAFARYLIPKYTGLRRELESYLDYYNTDRAHTGRWNRGSTPEDVIGKAKIWSR